MLNVSASVRFAVWTNAMLTGACDPDTAARHIVADDVGHHVSGLDGHPGTTLPVALNLLRTARATHAHLALPVPGDPIGLAGPAPFNEAAIDAGEAVILSGAEVGLVPAYVGPAVQWTAYPAAPPQSVVDLGEADRGLRAALIEATEALAALDVARWKPELADALIDIRRIGSARGDDLAPGYEARAVKAAATARRCLAIADAALADDGAAVTRGDADARRRAVLDLATAARRALVAACGPAGVR